jgi:hypothetical protein
MYDAIGVRFDATPITADKVLRALTRSQSPAAASAGPNLRNLTPRRRDS